jgi:uncharacterized repeat protein (TIGR01451 family)
LPTPPATTNDNAVAVLGIDPLGNVYGDSANASVRVIDPAIDLVKSVSADLVPSGSVVTYGFDVTNTGTSPIAADDVLANVLLGDASAPANPNCTSPTLVSGDTGGDGLLLRDPPETWHYECTGTITQRTVDLALVRGTAGTTFNPPLPVDVFDADGAVVEAFNPGISITKSAAPTELLGGGQVVYTYEVRNTGDVPLADVTSRITDDTCANVTFVSGDDDGDGLLDTPTSIFEDAADETWRFTCATTLSATTTNTVTVVGTPTDSGGVPLCGLDAPASPTSTGARQVPDPCDTSATANATVMVDQPGTIIVTKQTTQPTSQTFGFVFAGAPFALGSGASQTFSSLAPGTYRIDESATQGFTLAGIDCVDPSGGSVVDVANGTVAVGLAGGETVSCTFTNAPVPPTADLVVTKQVDPKSASPGDQVTFTVTVRNNGPGPAEGVVLTDNLPNGLVVARVPPGCVVGVGTLVCPIGHLDPGQSVTILVPVIVDAAGTVTNVATVDGTTIDPAPGNNSASESVIAAGTLVATGSDVGGLLAVGGGLVLAGVMMTGAGIALRRRLDV